MSIPTAIKSGSGFDRALASVEALALDEQEAFLEVARRRLAAARRASLARDVAAFDVTLAPRSTRLFYTGPAAPLADLSERPAL